RHDVVDGELLSEVVALLSNSKRILEILAEDLDRCVERNRGVRRAAIRRQSAIPESSGVCEQLIPAEARLIHVQHIAAVEAETRCPGEPIADPNRRRGQ